MPDFENVVVFVADSLRWDFIPDDFSNNNIVLKTVAQSTYSPPSFATLATGQYPPQHNVTHWTHVIPESIMTVFDIDGVSGGYYQNESAGSAMYNVLRQSNQTTLDKLNTPFFYMERDMKTHLPFLSGDNQSKQSAVNYFQDRKTNWEQIKSDYRNCVDKSIQKFKSRIFHLESRGLADDTLFILTSDHGDLFGEYGDVAHTSPACPELVYVPTVFKNRRISESDFQLDQQNEVAEHVDVVETAVSNLEEKNGLKTEGIDLFTESRPKPWAFNFIDANRRGYSFYRSNSIWQYDGGHEFRLNPRTVRLAYILYRLVKGLERHSLRGNVISLVRHYLKTYQAYGTPSMSKEEASRQIKLFVEELQQYESGTTTLSEEQKQHLEDLGYLT